MFWHKRKSREEDLNREIRSHLDLEAEEQQANGLSPEDARYAAKRALGNATQIKESVRATWGWTGFAHVTQDLRYSLRLLLKTPVLTGVAILSLALGIGANTAIFSVINALMLRSLPVSNPQQLVSIGILNPQHLQDAHGVSLAMFNEIRKHASTFSSVFIWTGGGIDNFEVNGVKYPGNLDIVSGDYFAALGVHALLGRVLTREDAPLDGRPSTQVAVISYGCWQHRFNGDPHVLGKAIRVDGAPLTIVGVSPPGFTGLAIDTEPEATVPAGFSSHGKMSRREMRDFIMYHTFGRLKPGVSISQVRAQMSVLWRGILKSTVPDSLHGAQRASFFKLRPDIQPAAHGSSYLRKQLKEPLAVLMALVGAVLLIACVNLANLLLARASSRRHEFSVRAALGAGRWPLMRMLLIEALLLSCTGAVLGVLVASWASSYLLQGFWAGFVPLALNPSPDPRVLLFTAALAIFTGVLFGIVPAWRMSCSEPATALSQTARTAGGRTGRFSRALLAAQVSLSLVLLIGATLFVRSLQNLQNADRGYHADHLLLMLLYPQSGHARIADRTAYFHQLSSRLSQLPGVLSVTYERVGPASGNEFKAAVTNPSRGTAATAVEEWAGPHFFRTMGMRLIAGHGFTWRDDEHAPQVVVISKNLAQTLFPNRNPIGRSIRIPSEPDSQSLKIIGVANNASLWKTNAPAPPAFYRAFLQTTHFNSGNAVIRTASDPKSIEHAAEGIVSSLGHQYSLRTETLSQRIGQTLVNQRMIALLASGFSLLALLLAAIGLYGVTSYAVTRRTAEIGIRMALGAMRTDVLRMVLGEVLLLVAIGTAVALPIAFACNKLISGMLFDVSATDPAVVLVSCAILVAVAAFAGYLPARRAARVDPMTALRYE